VIDPGTGSPNRLALVAIPPVTVLPEPDAGGLAAALYAGEAGVIVATVNEQAGTFTIGTCTSPLPAPGEYENAAAGLSYQSVGGTTAGPLSGQCRPDIISVGG
jgi:hypothetical protein